MRTRIGSPFLLTIISIFSILFFATFASAQREGAGNWASGVDGQTYTLNYEDKSRKRPNDSEASFFQGNVLPSQDQV